MDGRDPGEPEDAGMHTETEDGARRFLPWTGETSGEPPDSESTTAIRRRHVLAGLTIGGVLGLAGCLGDGEESNEVQSDDGGTSQDRSADDDSTSGDDVNGDNTDDQSAEGRVIAGSVQSAEPNEGGIADVTVTLVETDHATTTDESGSFRLAGLDDGIYDLRLQKSGYPTVTDAVSTDRGALGEIYLLEQDDIQSATRLSEAEIDGLLGENNVISTVVRDLRSRGFDLETAGRVRVSDERTGVTLLFVSATGEQLAIVSNPPDPDLPLLTAEVSETRVELGRELEELALSVTADELTVWDGNPPTSLPMPTPELFGGVQPEMHNAPTGAIQRQPSLPRSPLSFMGRTYGSEKLTKDLADAFAESAASTGCSSPDKPAVGVNPERRYEEIATELLCQEGVLGRHSRNRRLWITVVRTIQAVSGEILQVRAAGIGNTAAIAGLSWLTWDLWEIATVAAEATCRAARIHHREIETELDTSALDAEQKDAVMEHTSALAEYSNDCVERDYLEPEPGQDS